MEQVALLSGGGEDLQLRAHEALQPAADGEPRRQEILRSVGVEDRYLDESRDMPRGNHPVAVPLAQFLAVSQTFAWHETPTAWEALASWLVEHPDAAPVAASLARPAAKQGTSPASLTVCELAEEWAAEHPGEEAVQTLLALGDGWDGPVKDLLDVTRLRGEFAAAQKDPAALNARVAADGLSPALRSTAKAATD